MTAAVDRMKALVLECAASSAGRRGAAPLHPADDFDLLAEGVLDSLGFIKLIAELEQRLGIVIDFEAMDSERIATVGPLSRHLAALVP